MFCFVEIVVESEVAKKAAPFAKWLLAMNTKENDGSKVLLCVNTSPQYKKVRTPTLQRGTKCKSRAPDLVSLSHYAGRH